MLRVHRRTPVCERQAARSQLWEPGRLPCLRCPCLRSSHSHKTAHVCPTGLGRSGAVSACPVAPRDGTPTRHPEGGRGTGGPSALLTSHDPQQTRLALESKHGRPAALWGEREGALPGTDVLLPLSKSVTFNPQIDPKPWPRRSGWQLGQFRSWSVTRPMLFRPGQTNKQTVR